jgi:hypothetical protein
MPTEIPREQWPQFLGSFGHEHFGWRVTLQSRRPGRGKLIEVEDSPLQNLMDEQAGSHEQISIVLGEAEQRQETHVVENPTRVRLCAASLEIDAGDGTVTVVTLRAPVVP